MQTRKYARKIAVLLMVLISISIFTTSGSAFAIEEILGEDITTDVIPAPQYNTGRFANGLPALLNVAHSTDELSGLPSTGPYIMEEYYPPYEEHWREEVTGGFYSLQLISIEYGIITAIITQAAASKQFYAVSNNFTSWEIIGPVRYTEDDEDAMDAEYNEDDYICEIQCLSLSDTGVIRIERLPYQIEDRITWVGFVVIQDSAGNTRREQLRIFMDGMLLNPLPPEPVTAISDLQGFGWSREAVEFVVARDLMNTYLCMTTREHTAFHPNGNATRGYVLAAAVKALDLTVPYLLEDMHTPFNDVALSGRGIYIDIAKQLGLVAGIGNNNFAPDRSITRQDMMKMLYNIMMARGQIQPDIGLTALGRFSDFGEISSYARLPISSLASAGIIAGDGVSINPRGYVTRAEAAMFVRNLYRVGE
ncbi:MAG: S-layer homology domain-containing protein [Defluviitaleaceae bacterium]|nr:S-layer homology domain-containing protein [Defluviitaleaceae bacterium]